MPIITMELRVKDIVTQPLYMDVSLSANATFRLPLPADHNAFLFVFEGSVRADASGTRIASLSAALWGPGDEVEVSTGDQSARFLLAAGTPLHEPIAWYGPIVMNTEEELRTAFDEYRDGTFIKDA